MPKTANKLQSWQVFHYARKHLSRSALYAIFGRKNARTVDYWCENPKFTKKGEEAYDPLYGVKDLFAALDDGGHFDVLRSAVAFLLSGTSIESEEGTEIRDILPTLTEEILADFRAVAAMQAAIEAGEHPDEVAAWKRSAIAEIERTFAKYSEDYRER